MKLIPLIASATTAAVLATAGVSIAGATSSSGTSAGTNNAPTATTAAANRPIRRALARHGLEIAAKTIGITPAELVKELRAGKTIADIATEHGVQPQTVIAALVQAADARITKAHDAGKLTDDQASNLEQRVPDAVAKLVDTAHPGKLGKRQIARIRKGAVKVAADTIGITPADLVQELRSGKSVADVATEHGVQPQTVIAALVTAADARITKAHDAGKLTDDQAAKLEQRASTAATNFVNRTRTGTQTPPNA